MSTDWPSIAHSEEFVALERDRRRFTIAGLGVFFVCVATFFLLVAYARGFMAEKVVGFFSVAYVAIVALTVLAWILVALYLRRSERVWAPAAQRIVDDAGDPR